MLAASSVLTTCLMGATFFNRTSEQKQIDRIRDDTRVEIAELRREVAENRRELDRFQTWKAAQQHFNAVVMDTIGTHGATN